MLDALREAAAQQASHVDFILVYASSVYASTGVFEVFVLSALLLWYFNPRLRLAMDVISAHVVQKYNSGSGDWPSSTHRHDSNGITSSSALLRHKLTQGQHRNREKILRERQSDKEITDSTRAACKTQPWSLLSKRPPRPLMGASCDTCLPTNKPPNYYESCREGRILNILDVKSLDNPPTGFLSHIMPDIVHCCSFQRFDYPYIHETVLADESLKEAIESASREVAQELKVDDEDTYNNILRKQWDRASKVLWNLRSTLSDWVIRTSAWVFLKTLNLMFSSMSCPAEQINMLKEASETGLPMLYLPLHRSHMDYIALTLTLCNNSIRSPLVASGDNLKIPVFGWILRGLGAFYIKRRMDPVEGKKDVVYRALLHTYLTQCIEAGHSFEFFIEGRRSRTGKPSMPKGGLLSIVVDAYLSGIIQDALLVPVSVNCERLVDDSFLNELTGAAKDPESFTSAVKAIWKALTTRYGHIRIDFNQPFSLNELVRSFQSKLKGGSPSSCTNIQGLHVVPSSASLYGTDVVVEEHRQLVDSIARHIIYDSSRSTAVMSTNAVSLLLLYHFRDGVLMDELVASVDTMRRELLYCGKDMGFTGDSLDVINHALMLLGPGLVMREKTPKGEMIKAVTMLPNVLELAYYSNVLLPHYILQSVVGVCFLVEADNDSNNRVYHDTLVDSCLTLCQILQFEFLFTKTCQSLYEALNDTISILANYNIVSRVDKSSNRPRFEGRLLDIDDEYEDNPVISYKVDKDNKKLQIFAGMVRNLLDTYSITGHCLNALIGRSQTEREFVKYCLAQTKIRLENGSISYGESVNTETITNCIRMFEKMRVVDGHYQAGVKLLSLKQSCDSEDLLMPHIKRIHRYTQF